MDDPYKFPGWAFIIYGGFTSLALIWAAYLVGEPRALSPGASSIVVAMFGFLLFTHLLALLGGVLLLAHSPIAHKVAFPASLFMLISFPVGTILGMIYVWRWLQDN